MLLAEALVIRADIQNKIKDLEDRLYVNATVQAGETTAEDPNMLLSELEKAMQNLEDLVSKINLSNAVVTDDNGNTLTNLLARRDCLKQEIQIKRYFLNQASSTSERARNTEIIVKSSIDVADFRKKLDQKSAELRQLELLIQKLNWHNELMY